LGKDQKTIIEEGLRELVILDRQTDSCLFSLKKCFISLMGRTVLSLDCR